MHSMHQVRSLSSGPLIQQQQLVQQQELSGVPSNQQQQQQQQQQEQLSMTVLESLEPVQASQQQQAIIHHLGPVQAAPPQSQPTIQLHQLQPSSRHLIEQQQHELERRDEEHHNTNGNLHQNQTSDASVRQRQGGAQLEGIVADGGGPIVQWLLENYEIADGESLPRSTVYNHYLAHCRSLRMSSVNAASFGKLIRSVFVGLKTRRLGTRGHSKYHYFGVRAKQHVRFDWLHEGSNGPEGGRAGCSSAMMRDETNSNCGSDGGGQCGSETDSTGNCSGRLSTSMSQLTNGNHHTSGGGQAQNQHVPDHQSSKRLKRLQVSNGMMPDNLNHNYQEHDGGGATLEDLDHQHQNQHPHQHQLHQQHQHQQQQQHLHHNEMHYQDDLSQQQQQVSNGMHYGPVHPINGYAKQAQVAYGHEQFSGSAAFGGSYDLASLRQHLDLERAANLVQDSWPERESNQLESQLRARGSTDKQAVTSSEDKSDEVQDFEQLINLIEPFERCYKSHFKRMVELMSELNFVELERLWCVFWQAEAQHWTRSNSTIDAESNTQLRHSSQYTNGDEQLTFEQLRQLTSQPTVMERVAQIDRKLYSAIEGFLVVDMLSPMPRPLAQNLRSFALNICPWLEAALKGYDGDFVSRKLRLARAFEQALRRCTSINHLSAASRAIWSKRAVLAQMSADLSRLDLGDIEHQVASLMNQEKFFKLEPAHEVGSLLMEGASIELENSANSSLTSAANATMTTDTKMGQNEIQMANDDIENSYTSQQLNTHQQTNASSQNNTTTTTTTTATNTNTNPAIATYNCMEPGQLVQSFLRLLENPFPASAWPDWCRSLVESRVSGNSLEEASNFILRWNFYISLIMRELTLRSAPSLGSFQLIRLLFDEFIYYSVMSKLNQEKSAQKFHSSRV